MADAKKCDRCGKLFEPYIKAEDMRQSKQSDSPGYINIRSRKIIFKNNHSIEEGNFDLCKECNDSFLKWLSKPKVVKHERSEATKENKQKECNIFGAFDGSIDCLMCPQCNECREVTNSIKEASLDGGDANA